MRRLIIVAALVLVFAARTPARAQIKLPIEVVGRVGVTKTATFSIPPSFTPSKYTVLTMRAHGLGYADKAAVSLNGGPWTPLNNRTCVTADPMAKALGGIGGSFNTLRLEMPVPPGALKSGENTIAWKLNKTDYISIAFRILAFNFQTAEGFSLLVPSDFVEDDPAKWTAPLTDLADIAAGKAAWHSAELIQTSNRAADGTLLASEQSTPIKARCADCHTLDGHDLKYFNYSNEAIVERSKFHGLSQKTGQQIASYIRSLPGPAPGRPWNPPYQPGPGLDTKPVESWAAGAGIDAVLKSDQETFKYIFPSGRITASDIATNKTENLREIPVDLELPDWNHWLPRVHPKDAWGGDAATQDVFTFLDKIRAKLAGPDAPAYVKSLGMRRDIITWNGYLFAFLRSHEPAQTSSAWTPHLGDMLYSTSQWTLVKQWEMMQEFKLEGYGPVMYGSVGEPRTWFTQTPFYTAPGIVGVPFNQNGIGGSSLSNLYLTVAWYHIQAVLDSGNRRHLSNYPVDWPYFLGALKNMDVMTGQAHGMMVTLYLVKTLQNQDNGIGPDHPTTGWDPNHAGDISVVVDPGAAAWWTQTNSETRRRILGALITSWLKTAGKFTPDQYYAGRVTAPSERVGAGLNFASKISMLIRRSEQWGVDPAVVGSLRDWARTVWPATDWNAVRWQQASLQ